MDHSVIESLTEFEGELRARLAAAAAANLVNILDVPGLRESFAETHRELEADERRHGAESAGTYWNLAMADWSPEENAIFVLAVWGAEALSVFMGAGERFAILGVCDRFSMEEVEEVVAAMEVGFQISRSEVRIARALAEDWVAAQG
jgi:hypothetical protein